MENILGHTKDLTLYGSCGNVMYTFVNLKYVPGLPQTSHIVKKTNGQKIVIDLFIIGLLVDIQQKIKDVGM